jgi:hypothetical protein
VVFQAVGAYSVTEERTQTNGYHKNEEMECHNNIETVLKGRYFVLILSLIQNKFGVHSGVGYHAIDTRRILDVGASGHELLQLKLLILTLTNKFVNVLNWLAKIDGQLT